MRLMACALFLAAAMTAAAAHAQPGQPPAPPAPPTAPHTPPPTDGWARYADATEVQLRNVAAIVRVIPQDRADVSVSVRNPGPLPEPRLTAARNRLVIDGRLHRNASSCEENPRRSVAGFAVDVRGHGRVESANLPVIHIRMPREAVLSIEGATRLNLGRSETLRLRMAGCGDADIERVAGEAEVALSGDPNLRLYEAGRARVAIAGDGDVTIGAVRDGLTASIAGLGNLTAAHVDGPTSIVIQGQGDVRIRDGRATTLTVVIAGAGDVVHQGVAERLSATILGAGDVRVRRVEGEISRRVLGAGEVIVSPR